MGASTTNPIRVDVRQCAPGLSAPLLLKFQRRNGDTLLTMRAWRKDSQVLLQAENYVTGVVYLLKTLAWKQKLALWLR